MINRNKPIDWKAVTVIECKRCLHHSVYLIDADGIVRLNEHSVPEGTRVAMISQVEMCSDCNIDQAQPHGVVTVDNSAFGTTTIHSGWMNAGTNTPLTINQSGYYEAQRRTQEAAEREARAHEKKIRDYIASQLTKITDVPY